MPDFAAAYRETFDRVVGLLREAGEARTSSTVVPACPAWTINDLVAHLIDIAASYAIGRHTYPIVERDGRETAALDRSSWATIDVWTQQGVDARKGCSLEALLEEWSIATDDLCSMMRGERDLPPARRELLSWAAVGDLSAHADDIRGTLGLQPDVDSYANKLGFAMAVYSAGVRAEGADLPPLRITTSRGDLQFGNGGMTIEVDWYELKRVLSGRRSLSQIEALFAPVDPTPYLEVLTAHPPPTDPLAV